MAGGSEKTPSTKPRQIWKLGDHSDHQHGSNTPIFAPEVFETIEAKIDELDGDLRKLGLDIHARPELGFEEHHAHDLLTAFIEKHGFEVRKNYKLQTAFLAKFTRGTGGRTLGINSEMDALPGIGHACGHNLIAISGLAMACAVKTAMEKHNISGTVVLLGTPAEEGGGGKAILFEHGAYEGIDVCIMCHPGPGLPGTAFMGTTSARQPLEVEYHGKTAHAAHAPWEGRNAMDAAVLAYNSVAMLRQQLKPDHRVHGTINGKNWTVNVIPDYAKMEWLVRAASSADVEAASKRVAACLQAAGSATGCRAEVKYAGVPYKELRQNGVLSDEFSAIYASKFGEVLHVKEPSGASTDFGNISFEIPSLHPLYAVPTEEGGVNHTAAFTKASATDEAHLATLRVCKALAAAGVRVLTDEAFYLQVRDAFEKDVKAKV